MKRAKYQNYNNVSIQYYKTQKMNDFLKSRKELCEKYSLSKEFLKSFHLKINFPQITKMFYLEFMILFFISSKTMTIHNIFNDNY